MAGMKFPAPLSGQRDMPAGFLIGQVINSAEISLCNAKYFRLSFLTQRGHMGGCPWAGRGTLGLEEPSRGRGREEGEGRWEGEGHTHPSTRAEMRGGPHPPMMLPKWPWEERRQTHLLASLEIINRDKVMECEGG